MILLVFNIIKLKLIIFCEQNPLIELNLQTNTKHVLPKAFPNPHPWLWSLLLKLLKLMFSCLSNQHIVLLRYIINIYLVSANNPIPNIDTNIK